jgi:hypothetical protein
LHTDQFAASDMRPNCSCDVNLQKLTANMRLPD